MIHRPDAPCCGKGSTMQGWSISQGRRVAMRRYGRQDSAGDQAQGRRRQCYWPRATQTTGAVPLHDGLDSRCRIFRHAIPPVSPKIPAQVLQHADVSVRSYMGAGHVPLTLESPTLESPSWLPIVFLLASALLDSSSIARPLSYPQQPSDSPRGCQLLVVIHEVRGRRSGKLESAKARRRDGLRSVRHEGSLYIPWGGWIRSQLQCGWSGG